MPDLIVSIAVSGISGTMTEYVRRLSRCGIEVAIDDLSTFIGPSGFSIATKLNAIRRQALRFFAYRFLIFSDGWDVMFYGTGQDLLSKMPSDKVLWAAEKNCWPNSLLADRIPNRGPWRFVNGGLLAGTPMSYLTMCDRIESHPLYRPDYIDQEFMNVLLANGADYFEIDSETHLFFCLFRGYDELGFERGKPINHLYKTSPLFIHANGNWPTDELYLKYEGSLK